MNIEKTFITRPWHLSEKYSYMFIFFDIGKAVNVDPQKNGNIERSTLRIIFSSHKIPTKKENVIINSDIYCWPSWNFSGSLRMHQFFYSPKSILTWKFRWNLINFFHIHNYTQYIIEIKRVIFKYKFMRNIKTAL